MISLMLTMIRFSKIIIDAIINLWWDDTLDFLLPS